MSITIEQIVQETRAHAEMDPFRALTDSETCRYFDEEEARPLCIIGHALYDIDVPVATLIALDHDGEIDALPNPSPGISATIGSSAAMETLGIDPENLTYVERRMLAWLACVQRHQDVGGSWAEAVDAADREHPYEELPLVDLVDERSEE